ncbi:ABC transporter substrate-binding protein [Acidipropionibacterium jensenii]|uniref:ABC transporter substrate-binding protein n=1 Tax=Acidipropionibacterium jensenii TaxID=1749 RepID=UPI00264919B9|nr:ABC transporter substrate-binding protein [Acidipropionibacterium jensenii]MDN5978446.1 ABC transporter substrate-binding protein [Acidipropionibacterium jensenii]MDN5997536.1 ABC transporter substrate-binding protein [Acidipropionibacterium jensenii]MDN6425671.1 ABC transporter substrate-binding protein [Acidipropionibacterium jensenii]MDN6425674.1 ABC transporter substrate-binding protein [Acidipropionibacterium jensenii]MDN6442924.1 ABC transporter substrate-binding protein [Acidipropion
MRKSCVVPAGIVALTMLLVGCGSGASETSSAASASASPGAVTVTNCGQKKTYPRTTKLFANDGNIISISLAAGAEKDLVAVSSLERDKEVISLKYGDGVKQLRSVAPKYPSLENILAANPQVVFAGWNYGFSEEKNLTPDMLNDKGIDTYLLSESCKQANGDRGTMPPWTALTTDITNIGAITGHKDVAKKSVADIETRRKALEAAPRAAKEPVAFLFDSGSDTIFSSGSFGAPQAMMDAAGAKNALADVKDTWTAVSWERITKANPDVIYFVDYPPQTFQQKVALLKSNPASKNLKAVKEGRFVNLPYAMWTSGPLNIDGAEYIRASLEAYGLQPRSGIKPQLDIRKLNNLPGNTWLK